MSDSSKPAHQRTTMAILTSGAALRPKEGQFLGGIAFDLNPPTEKQAQWLEAMEQRYLTEASR